MLISNLCETLLLSETKSEGSGLIIRKFQQKFCHFNFGSCLLLTLLCREWVAELMEEMRIGEKGQKEKNCQLPAGGQLLHSHLVGSQEQQLESLAAGGFSAESRIPHQLGSQDSLGQGAGGSQAEWTSCSSRDEQQALARSKIRSKSLKCNQVNSSLLKLTFYIDHRPRYKHICSDWPHV